MRQCRRLTEEQSAIRRSPPAGEKPVNSGRKRPSLPCFSPADAPRGASVPPHFHQRGRAIPPNHNMKGRSGEACALGAQAAGTYSGDDRWRSDLEYVPAVPGRRPTAGTSPRYQFSVTALCASAAPRLCVDRPGGWLCDAFVSLCLRVCDGCARLCVSLCALCLCGESSAPG